MLAFKVEIDGVHVVTAGVDDWSVLALHVNACRGDPGAALDHARCDRLRFSVGGLSEPDPAGVSYHFRWPELDLQVGSRVLVTIVEANEPTPPARRYRSDAEVQEDPFTEEEAREMRYQDYLDLKKEFESGQS